MKIKFTTFSDHVAKVYAEINRTKIQKLGEAIDRYGRHERGAGCCAQSGLCQNARAVYTSGFEKEG